ncbi:MAG: aminopeptidase P family protein [Lachnospiraceae bacterium]|nr:aminopeptidase P family protein [Lachnospiraceae bacterium]
MNTIQERIAALRGRMKEEGVDAYLVPTDDFHASEYVGDYFKCRKYITGFTGSAGTAVIMQDMAGLWTDGRYFIQAADQLAGSGVTLFKMGEPGVPTIQEFLEEKLGVGECLGFDGRTVSTKEAEELQEALAKKGASVNGGLDLVGDIWNDRPALSCEPVMELDVKWTGESRVSKIGKIRKAVQEKGADLFVLTSLDDIAWLLNIRGGDIHCCPVVLSYLVMSGEEILLFANEKAFPDMVKRALAADGVSFCPYNDIYEYVSNIPAGKTVLLDRNKVNSRLTELIPKDVTVLDQENPTLLPKAVKNPVEVENERIAHIKDGVALTKFIFWLKMNVGRLPITELGAEKKLYELRSEQENFMGNSFDPIISYGAHAAIVHYSATSETDIPVEPHGLLLADTGGHYREGSTDITRTIALGPTTDVEKLYFTAVLRGHLNLAAARFRSGTTGLSLDYLARAPLWELGKDFNHGTGHGVGYYLNVHEGPNSFHWKVTPTRRADTPFEVGMITSDEPGYYQEGSFGVRHENLIVCVNDRETECGTFLRFEHLTMVPFDLDAIVPEQMTMRERELLNDYHAQVYETISPYLDKDERAWLKEATREI